MEHDELRDLLDAGELFEVLDHDHPEFPWYISFDDAVASEHDALLDELVSALEERPRIHRAAREDREVILVGGDLDGAWLESFLDTWFREHLQA